MRVLGCNLKVRQAGEWDVQEVEHEAGMCGRTSGELAIVREDRDETWYRQGHEVRMSVQGSIGVKFGNMVTSSLLVQQWVVVVWHNCNKNPPSNAEAHSS